MAEELRERAVSAAVAVARGHGVEVREPIVLSDRSNLIVRLAPAPLVARVATSTADVRPGGARDWLARDVGTASHLAAAGANVVPPAGELPAGPHTQDGLSIAFWRFVEHDTSRPPSPSAAGEALRRLHGTLEGFPGELPPYAAWPAARPPARTLPGGAPFAGALWTALLAERHPNLRERAEQRLSRWLR